MIRPQHFIISMSAAARILGQQIQRFEIWASVVFVIPARGRARFMSKKAFYRHFAEFRQQSARSLEVFAQWGSKFEIVNPANGKIRNVHITSDNRVFCGCDDYRNQIDFLGRGVCKHGYRALQALGFNSLSDYISSPARQRLTNLVNSGGS